MCPSAIRPASSASTLAPGPASRPPSVFTPCFAAAAKSAMVSIRSAATPSARASSTYPPPWVSMKASTPPGAAALIRSATPSPYATGITPWLFSHSWLLSLARPMTVAPVRCASWTPSEPTPPAAPEMTTVSPSLGWTACTAPHAVTPATYSPPATSHETFSGLGVRSPASTRTSSAWEARLLLNPITSSPGENPPTRAPTSSTTPARSLPCPDGNVDGNSSATAPARITASLGLMPAAFTRTRTCPSPGTGRSTSSTRSTSIPPNSSYLTAFDMVSPRPRSACANVTRTSLADGLRPPEFEHRNGADPGSLAFVLGKARVAPRLFGVNAVVFSAGQFADGYLVCLGSALDGGVLAGGQVAVPVRMGGCSSLGCEDVDDVRLGVVGEVHHRGDVLPPAFAAAVMHQDQRSALEGSANPALVRPELRDGLRVPVECVAHVQLLPFRGRPLLRSRPARLRRRRAGSGPRRRYSRAGGRPTRYPGSA